MPLVPLDPAGAPDAVAPRLTLSAHARRMASVETTAVERRELGRKLRAVGKIRYNEPALATVTARVDGYAERLFVGVTGVEIRAGDHLVEIYSPELAVAEQELLNALAGGGAATLVNTGRLKLRRLGLTDAQVDALVRTRTAEDRVTLLSPIDGTVIEKSVVQNGSFKAGDVLYRVANLDSVWAYLEIYELDLAWIRHGQPVLIAAEAYPGRLFTGTVTFIQPVLDEETRTVSVPVHVDNRDHALKPGMYVSGTIETSLGSDGRAAPTGVEGKYACRMDPQVLEPAAGPCRVCGMPLERIPGSPAASEPASVAGPEPAAAYACPMKCEGAKTYGAPGSCPVCRMRLEHVDAPPRQAGAARRGLNSVPVTAVLDSGVRSLVYVELGPGTYEPREVTVGPRIGEYVPVLAGLAEGERVVTRGGFLIDSQFQITGQASLLYPGGLHATTGPGEAPPGAPAETSGAVAPSAPPAGRHRH